MLPLDVVLHVVRFQAGIAYLKTGFITVILSHRCIGSKNRRKVKEGRTEGTRRVGGLEFIKHIYLTTCNKETEKEKGTEENAKILQCDQVLKSSAK